jgi:hypothetical protein
LARRPYYGSSMVLRYGSEALFPFNVAFVCTLNSKFTLYDHPNPANIRVLICLAFSAERQSWYKYLAEGSWDFSYCHSLSFLKSKGVDLRSTSASATRRKPHQNLSQVLLRVDRLSTRYLDGAKTSQEWLPSSVFFTSSFLFQKQRLPVACVVVESRDEQVHAREWEPRCCYILRWRIGPFDIGKHNDTFELHSQIKFGGQYVKTSGDDSRLSHISVVP